jgi:hypothetical protein
LGGSTARSTHTIRKFLVPVADFLRVQHFAIAINKRVAHSPFVREIG